LEANRRNFLGGTAAALGVFGIGSRTLATGQTPSNQFSIRTFGARGDGVSDDTKAVQAAVLAAKGYPIHFPEGKYRLSAIVGKSIQLVGDGAHKTIIELLTGGTDSLLRTDELQIEGIGFSDRGRSLMDHRASPDVYLFECKSAFRAENCVFLTDRSVLLQTPLNNAKWTIVKNCVVERVNTPLTDEEDRINVFTCQVGVPFVHFDNLLANALVARSVINATYQDTAGMTSNTVSATVENCHFDYIHNSDGNREVKVVFLQGYSGHVANNKFTDCFGRHIDLLGSFHRGSAGLVRRPNEAVGNDVRYSHKRRNAQGSSNDEAGSIYCRYADVIISQNRLDFSNLRLSSAGYNAIAVRHGYESATIKRNIVIGAKAHAIAADISDAVDTDNCALAIIANQLNSVRSTRLPISIANNSKTKMFSSVEIRDNLIDYAPASTGIVFESGPERISPFAVKNAHIEDNRNQAFASLDEVSFNGFPFSLDAPNIEVKIRISLRDQRGRWPRTAIEEVIKRSISYKCKSVIMVPLPGSHP